MTERAADFRTAVWQECTKIIIDSLYSARGHQVAAHRWAPVVTVLGVPASVATALTSAGAGVAAISGHNALVTSSLALIATALSAIRAVLQPEQTLQRYENKGAAYLALRNDVTLFRDVLLKAGRCSEAEAEAQLRSFEARLNSLNAQPPMRIPGWAYRGAKAGIQAGESSYEGDPLWVSSPF